MGLEEAIRKHERIEVDDYVRWLGKQKPIGLAWIGFAILQLAAAIFIITEAYIRFNEYRAEAIPEVTPEQVIEYMRNTQPKD